MSRASDVLALAASQIGYSRWNDPESGTKYGRYWAQKLGMPWLGANGVAFCDMGVNWTFDQLGMLFFEGSGIYYVPATVEQARAKGLLVDPRACAPGDALVFDWDGVRDGDHIGLCEVNRGGYVQTIEYNTGNGQVLRRTRDWSTVSYAIRPPYGGAQAPAPQPTPKPSGIAEDGIWGTETTLAYQRLRDCPFKDGVISRQNADWRGRCPGLGTGWEWVPGGEEPGSQTISDFQRLVGASVDGLIGPDTINRAIVFFSRLSGADLQDGRIDCPSITVKAFQRWINNGGRF